MNDSRRELERKARVYATRHGLELGRALGSGQDGSIWATNRKSAVKALERARSYQRELDAYRRLREHGVLEIKGFAVPEFIDCDDELWMIEIGIVKPPCILDFAKSYVDEVPDYSAEVLADEQARMAELFEDRLPTVQGILRSLRGLGIYYLDAKPGNIMFRETP